MSKYGHAVLKDVQVISYAESKGTKVLVCLDIGGPFVCVHYVEVLVRMV